ncbi:hypothetical protein GCWU000323_00473 [Leptotrichia hofstadii F0254]|uniref:Uncharacterized protein n=1 Tax=Leptotrichia hofstadii F0254 TaxID=634994 RepID=C9MW34_9FUSO|nr:hypothetical protein GCWU000323_00473 [Leptotrichia hofstadii F0254]
MRYHSLYVDDIPENLEVTAKSEDGVAMAVEHKSKIFLEYSSIQNQFLLNMEKI